MDNEEEFVTELNEVFDSVFAVIQSENGEDIPDVLYHYTTVDALIGISKGKKIWASNTRFLNDAKEFEFGREIGTDSIKSIRSATDRETEVLKNLFCNQILETLRPNSEIQNTYATCFSPNPDQLSQWRGYTAKTGAVCIGFRTELLRDLTTRGPISVSYNADLFARCFVDLVERYLSLFEKYFRANNQVEICQILKEVFAANFAIMTSYFKHPGFKEESEIRIVFESWQEIHGVEFRSNSGLIVPYVEVDLASISDDFIVEVIVGPTNDPSLMTSSVTEFLKLMGKHDIQLRTSEIPYRVAIG
ncbi:MAG: DUF2971 domain-containing protein [Rhodobacter sp.]|nr:DUF2971 domain-containing protein [Rhodobacter sp.]